MNEVSIQSVFEARFDGDRSSVEFSFAAETGEVLLASSECACEATVRGWLAVINSGQSLRLVLTPHTYLGREEDDDCISHFDLTGSIIASFSAGEPEYSVPANDFVDYACRLLSRYSATEYRVFRLLNLLSPHTADAFAESLVGLDLRTGPSTRASGPRRVKPTLRTPPSDELDDDQIAWLFEDRTRGISLRQLEEFLPMMMKNLKPHLQGAGILPHLWAIAPQARRSRCSRELRRPNRFATITNSGWALSQPSACATLPFTTPPLSHSGGEWMLWK